MRPKILVVDDSKMLRDMVVYTLNEGGYPDVAEAEDGAVALSLVQKERFDIVITDINMPNMDGFSFTQNARGVNGYESTPILILTTESSDEMKQKGKSCGATGWIVKPFVPEELLEVISILTARLEQNR